MTNIILYKRIAADMVPAGSTDAELTTRGGGELTEAGNCLTVLSPSKPREGVSAAGVPRNIRQYGKFSSSESEYIRIQMVPPQPL